MRDGRLRHISLTDSYTFQYNNDVMRQCFNSSAEADYGQYAVQDTGDGCQAWFPKERVWKNGEWVAGSTEVNWKNHIEKNGLIIVMELNSGEKPKDSPGAKLEDISHVNPVYTFWKTKDEPYRYVGTYMVDKNASIPRRQIFRRIDTEIDLTPWYNSINLSYIINSDDGLSVYRKIYIDGDYRKQKDRVNIFLKNIDNNEGYGDKDYLDTSRDMQEKYPLSVFRHVTEDTIYSFINDINSALVLAFGVEEGGLIDLNDMSFAEMAGGFVDIINPRDHNDVIRNSAFGEKLAGKLLALFNTDYYIYSLSEEETDYYISKLKIDVPEESDLTEKHCLLYFWKQCNADMDDWTALQFVRFLEFVWPNPYRKSKIVLHQNTYKIDYDWLEQAMKWFVRFVVTQQGDSDISFCDGWLKATEGYKYEVYTNAHNALDYDVWEKEMIGSGLILDCVISAFRETANNGFNNIVQFQNITKFKNKAVTDVVTSEEILFGLFKEEDPSVCFDEACQFWGKWYPELSYLLFLKDKDKYIPVKTDNHIRRFKKLKIDTNCLERCSWDNYKTFIKIHEEIRNRLEQYLGMTVSLLDAHSFVWVMDNASDDLSNYDNTIPMSVSENDDPYESTVVTGEKEGRITYHYVTKYERNPRNRAEAVKIHGYRCMACGFDFEKFYGELGKEFIEVHHVKPLHSLSDEVVIDPKKDLICLCSNCHRMVHKKRGSVLSLDQLRKSIVFSPYVGDEE